MANNYIQFSAQFALPKGAKIKKVKAWLALAKGEPREPDDTTDAWDGTPDSPNAPWRDSDDPDNLPCFQCDVDENGLWVYSEENGGTDGAVALVQEYWAKFGPPDGDEEGIIEFACTCEKMRVGEFGGGAVAFTRTKVKWFNPWMDAEKWLKKLKRVKKEKKKRV